MHETPLMEMGDIGPAHGWACTRCKRAFTGREAQQQAEACFDAHGHERTPTNEDR